MEFWGVEVKPGEPLKVRPEVFRLIHISQAALGEVKEGKGPNYVPIHLKVGDKKYVIGTLSAEDRPQLLFDLVLEREFELSHDWKDGSIYFAGYVADDDTGEVESSSDGEDFSDEENQVDALQNGKLEPNVDGMKPAKPKSSEKPVLKHAELKKDEPELDEDDDDDSDDSEDDDEGEESSELEDDSSDDLEDMDSEDSDDENKNLVSQETKSGKKRPSKTATEMLVPAAKKTKSSAPQKSGGKSPATNGKSKKHNTKSGSQVSSKSRSKPFNSENALQSHAKAKHGDK